MKRDKPSLAFILSALCLITIALSILSMSPGLLYKPRRISYTQITATTKENTARMRDQVAAIITSHVALLEHTVHL
ncbi:MAG: hypothetical protein LBB80_06170 [Treponema sp.]|jgi:hypothetical protein|nr:hypothetical protein [Treponema sp.]